LQFRDKLVALASGTDPDHVHLPFRPAAEKRGEVAFTRSLIGAGKQRRRHGNADLPCSFAVYHLELSLGAVDHRATEFV
jgi:hypothetical protein